MSCWTKPELENMLEDVVNELDLSESAISKHGPMGTAPAELVRLVLDEKDRIIERLKKGIVMVSPEEGYGPVEPYEAKNYPSSNSTVRFYEKQG